MTDPTTSDIATDIEPDPVADLRERAERIRTEMGGSAAVQHLRERGERNAREHVDAFLDTGSFAEAGTFATSMNPADVAATPGDGRISGVGTIDGRPVTVVADDVTVKGGTISEGNTRKLERMFQLARVRGVPLVYFAQSPGVRTPDAAGSEGLAELGALVEVADRRRAVPVATAVVGPTFGEAATVAAMSDLVVQVRGSRLAATAPDVEDVGDADMHDRVTGQIDLAVDSPDDACEAIRRFLAYLPPNAWTAAPRGEPAGDIPPDPGLAAMVPAKRSRAYDMRRVVARIADEGSVFELRPGLGRGLFTGLARIDGWPVGIFASNPMFQAGVLEPVACEKGIRLLVLCDAFNIPAVFLEDVPGFLVGRQVEHGRILYRAIRFLEALMLCSAPTLTVIVRKAFGLAYQSMNGRRTYTEGFYAWPGAEIGFMDPEVGVNVLYGDRLTKDEKAALAAQLAEATSPYDAAAPMNLDEIIDPATTRQVLARDLNLLAGRRVPPPEERPLTYWPSC